MDIAIYVCSLQRAAKNPTVEHYIKQIVFEMGQKKEGVVVYHPLTKPCKMLVISDSAFRKEDTSGLSIRGAVLAICEEHPSHPGGNMHV
jgi:hypothetical protein